MREGRLVFFRMTDVLIHSPFPRQDSQGNSATADRLEGILQDAGLVVSMEQEWYSGYESRWMIALNARRSAGAVMEYRDACPDGRVIVVVTGTDINHPAMLNEMSPTRQTMSDADHLVLLHEVSMQLIPSELHEKCHVIYPSVQLPCGLSHQATDDGCFEVVMAGNVRKEKNLPLAIDACELLPEDSPVVVRVYGDSSEELAHPMMVATAGTLPFQWKGKADHIPMLQKMAAADLLLNSSTQEGGANAICEAICLGLPVVASRISGNVGMLGDDYAGFFTSGDAPELAQLLKRCAEDEPFYRHLKDQVSSRSGRFTYTEEARLWAELV